MVTSNKIHDKKLVKMTEHNHSVVVPQRTLLSEVNEYLSCPICRGYYIDATTIVECLHSFCRSCIIKHLQVKSYCPVCEMMINSAKPNIKLDKALQDIVYKLVPGLFQREMERRQQFYASRPGTAAAATPEQRGEDTERIIFSPEDVISFSLEYADITDADSVSSKSSDASNEAQPTSASSRRFLQCPAVVNISHLKKFLSMKFNIDSNQFAVDILYKRVPLPDYYTLMDIAYIYNWKRNEPMRFFYQIIDYIAIRNRLFDVNRKGSHFEDEKMAGDDSPSSPASNLPELGSEEASSGTDSPMLKDNQSKHSSVNDRSDSNQGNRSNENSNVKNKNDNPKADEEVEKSQFLNSFELTAKSNSSSKSTSPVKSTVQEKPQLNNESTSKTLAEASKDLKRKQELPQNISDMKKLKNEGEKANVSNLLITTPPGMPINNLKPSKEVKSKPDENVLKNVPPQPAYTGKTPSKDYSKNHVSVKQQHFENSGVKRATTNNPNTPLSSPKKKPEANSQTASVPQKTISPLKLQLPKPTNQEPHQRPIDAVVKSQTKKMPDLKPSVTSPQNIMQNKQPIPKIRMDLLANNSDPTMDRSKILSQVKSTLGTSPTLPTAGTGDPLKSLFDSCKINIPSSLSITLTDQKQEARNLNETTPETKKNMVNKNLITANSATHKVPAPPVHNYIEILKLPESDPKKQNKVDSNIDQKLPPPKPESSTPQNKTSKLLESSGSSTKGPVPNLKPIADTKHGKASGNYSPSPITFQQTFEQQLQTLQTDKKPKLPKTKAQVPKLVPASPKTFTAAVNKLNQNKPNSSSASITDMKPNIALDLSTAPNIQQSKAFETMQSIANLAKKQALPAKPQAGSHNNYSAMPPRPNNTTTDSARMPLTINQIKLDKMSPNTLQSSNGRQDNTNKPMQLKPAVSPSILSSPIHTFQPIQGNISSQSQPSPRSQTRSPSCSPKLVIAEDKQPNTPSEPNLNQSNQISSTQLGGAPPKSDSPKVTPGPSKPAVKSLKPVPPANKISGIRQPITPTMNPVLSPTMDYLSQPQLMAQHAFLRHQMEMQSAWLKARNDLLKNMTNIAHQSPNDFNNKDK